MISPKRFNEFDNYPFPPTNSFSSFLEIDLIIMVICYLKTNNLYNLVLINRNVLYYVRTDIRN